MSLLCGIGGLISSQVVEPWIRGSSRLAEATGSEVRLSNRMRGQEQDRARGPHLRGKGR